MQSKSKTHMHGIHGMLLLQEITLSEALTGTMFYVQHLDGRVLEVSSLPGEVIKPDSWKCINEEGMPVHGRPYEKGNLYIRFAVKFPESLSSQEVEQLKQVLPGAAQQQVPMSEDEPEQVSYAPLSLCLLHDCSAWQHEQGFKGVYQAQTAQLLPNKMRTLLCLTTNHYSRFVEAVSCTLSGKHEANRGYGE